jgi:signal transduction histidine kinase
LNAAEAMNAPGSIEVRMEGDGTACRVTVANTGPGIGAAQANRILESFVTSKKWGTGLGLPLSRRIVRLHGGDLTLLSKAPPGATFLLTVPLHDDRGRPQLPPAQP